MKCMICGSDAMTVIGKRSCFDTFAGYAPFVQSLKPFDRDIVVCGACGFAHIDPMYGPDDLSTLYGSYDKFAEANRSKGFDRNHIPIWLNQFKALGIADWATEFAGRHSRRPRMLDVGCGYGRLMHLFDLMGFEVKGIELNPDAVQSVRSSFGYTVEACDFSDFSPRETYDVICLCHVIEHVIDPSATMKRLADLLSPGGLLLIETPWAEDRGTYEDRYCDIYHTLFFNHLSLCLLGLNNGFAVRATQRICFADDARHKYVQVLYSRPDTLEIAAVPPAQAASLGALFCRLERENSNAIDHGWEQRAVLRKELAAVTTLADRFQGIAPQTGAPSR